MKSMVDFVTNLKIGFIGSGRVGLSLAKYFASFNLEIIGVINRDNKNEFSTQNQKINYNVNQLVKAVDVIFVTTTDDQIIPVLKQIDNKLLSQKVFLHCSGSLQNHLIKQQIPEINLGSLHPVAAICDRNDVSVYNNITFTFCGNNEIEELVKIIFKQTKNNYLTIADEAKVEYHLALVEASNLVGGLLNLSVNHLLNCNIGSEPEIMQLLEPLVKNNINQLFENGIKAAITGPAARGDFETMSRHHHIIANQVEKQIYQGLSDEIIDLKGVNNDNNGI